MFDNLTQARRETIPQETFSRALVYCKLIASQLPIEPWKIWHHNIAVFTITNKHSRIPVPNQYWYLPRIQLMHLHVVPGLCPKPHR